MRRTIDWPKIAALAIDITMLYVLCVWMLGPIFAGAQDVAATNPLASNETAHRILEDHAIQVAVSGRTQGQVIFLLAVPCYFLAFSMMKRRTIGQMLVYHFSIPTESPATK